MSHNEERHSEAETVNLVEDEDERAILESENAVRQFDYVLDLIEEVARGARPFRLRVSIIQGLHRIALNGLSAYAGNWRPGATKIGFSKHVPPGAHLVAEHMEQMCEYVNDNINKKTALHLCAYVMWRLNWIHPFDDGNGRTSRAVSYYVLCGSLGYQLPGRLTIPEQISTNKKPYYESLEKADQAYEAGNIDVSDLESLLESYLAGQLVDALDDAKRPAGSLQAQRKLH